VLQWALYNARPLAETLPCGLRDAVLPGHLSTSRTRAIMLCDRCCMGIQVCIDGWTPAVRAPQIRRRGHAAEQSQNYDKSKGELIREPIAHVFCTGKIL
jgi:hypothetical protein